MQVIAKKIPGQARPSINNGNLQILKQVEKQISINKMSK